MGKRKPLGLGLIGCGAFGRFCAEAFSALEDVRLAAVADVRRDAAADFARRFGVPPYSDPAEMIARQDVDLVHVAAPPAEHPKLVLAAARAGKHVLCEKPLALTVAQADEMLAAVRQAGVLCPVNFVLRYNAVTEAVKAVLDSGVLGAPLSARLTNCAADSNLPPGHWFWDPAVSGGIFVEHGVHFFNLYAHWLGPGEVVDARAEAREGTGQQDRVACTVRHAPLDRPAVLVSHLHHFDQLAMMDRTDHRLVCELGDIRVDGWIPLTMTIDAAVDDAGLERLVACCPGPKIEIVEDFPAGLGPMPSRGTPRDVTRRGRLWFCPNADKQVVYADSVRALMADQLAFLRNKQHVRRVTEQDGRDALALAEAAVRRAGAEI